MVAPSESRKASRIRAVKVVLPVLISPWIKVRLIQEIHLGQVPAGQLMLAVDPCSSWFSGSAPPPQPGQDNEADGQKGGDQQNQVPRPKLSSHPFLSGPAKSFLIQQ